MFQNKLIITSGCSEADGVRLRKSRFSCCIKTLEPRVFDEFCVVSFRLDGAPSSGFVVYLSTIKQKTSSKTKQSAACTCYCRLLNYR